MSVMALSIACLLLQDKLIARVFTTHEIEMDVFHAKRIRAVTCGSSLAPPTRAR